MGPSAHVTESSIQTQLISARFKSNYSCLKYCIQLKMLELHLSMSEVPSVLAIMIMVVKLAIWQKSPLVS